MGSVVGEKLARLYQDALARHEAAIVLSRSGGARMQESLLPLMQMAKQSAMLARLCAERIPYISILTKSHDGRRHGQLRHVRGRDSGRAGGQLYRSRRHGRATAAPAVPGQIRRRAVRRDSETEPRPQDSEERAPCRLLAAIQALSAPGAIILGEGKDVFDLSREKPELRDRYGRNTFGQDCLVARRLVEAGVPYIVINYPAGWDTHRDHFQTMTRQCPQLDQGLAMLLQDLEDRGLLESTLVWCCGEFGRGPKIDWQPPWNGGRNHYGNVFTTLVAGGGFKGGEVVGQSDAKAEEVKDRPVYPVDLLGSIYQLGGIDSNAKLPHPMGLEARVLPATSDRVKSAGILTEIM